MSRRRILFITLHFAPEKTGNAPYSTGLAKALTADFDVEVVTAHPHYPEWRVAPGYGGWRRAESCGDVEVRRLQHYLPRQPTGLSRIASEASFAGRCAFPHVSRPDVILTMTPALAPVASALALGRRWRVPVGVVVQDLYSKAFAELGILGGRLDRVVGRFERSLLSRATGVVSIHESMAAVISRDYDVPRKRIAVIPNWTHVSAPTGDRTVRRKELGWSDGVLTVVHAGNMGAKQGLEHLIPVARLVDERRLPIRFVLIGSGGSRDSLVLAASGVDSVTFMDPLSDDAFMDTLAAADALLLHEKPGMKEMCVPSKLTSYFAASRPVLAITESESAAAYEVRESGAGVVVRPADPEATVQALLTLRNENLDRLGASGLAYARRTLDEDTALGRYRAWIHELTSSSGSQS